MSVELLVMAGDCDTLGHVNNAVYINYLEQALAAALADLGFVQDWRREGNFDWRLSALSIEYREPAVFGDRLLVDLWLAHADPLAPVFGCEIKRLAAGSGAETGRAICHLRSVWSRCARLSSEPVLIPASLLDAFPGDGGILPRHFDLPTAAPEIRAYEWHHPVAIYELGVAGLVRTGAFYNWLQESVDSACTQAGWPMERRLAAGMYTMQTRHDTQFFSFGKYGDTVRVISRAIEVRRLRGTWLQEVRSVPQGQLLARDYSTGVFLDLGGRPATPSQEMMRAIQYGD